MLISIASLRVSVFPSKLALTEPSYQRFIQWKNFSDFESSRSTSSSCGAESLQLTVDRSALSSRVVEKGDVTEEDEDDEDDIRFATLQSQFENKETVCNW